MPIYKVINYDYLAAGDNSDLAFFDFKCNDLVSTISENVKEGRVVNEKDLNIISDITR